MLCGADNDSDQAMYLPFLPLKPSYSPFVIIIKKFILGGIKTEKIASIRQSLSTSLTIHFFEA